MNYRVCLWGLSWKEDSLSHIHRQCTVKFVHRIWAILFWFCGAWGSNPDLHQSTDQIVTLENAFLVHAVYACFFVALCKFWNGQFLCFVFFLVVIKLFSFNVKQITRCCSWTWFSSVNDVTCFPSVSTSYCRR